MDRFEHAPQRRQRLGKPIGGRSAREPFEHHIRRGRSMVQRGGDPHQLVPLLGDQRQVHRGTKDGIESPIGGHPTHVVELLILQIFNARHELKA
jgi:hypothetical protein